ncbi:hypothetical protein GCM10009591_38260 [Brachybacterium tyrofermentans]
MVPQAANSNLVWHYTNATGLLGIVRDRELWATHSRFMNDKLEGSVMHSAVRDFLSSEKNLTSSQLAMIEMQFGFLTSNMYPHSTRVPQGNMFLLCGSRDNDALTLWRNYAREAVSFAVGLNPETPLGIIRTDHSLRNRWSDIVRWNDVKYTSAFSELPPQNVNPLREAAQSEDPGDQIVRISMELQRTLSGIKHSAFEDERETRIAFFDDSTSDWNFRAGRFGLTPYVRVGTSTQWGNYSDGSPKLPIEAIRVSANASEADIMAVHALLECYGLFAVRGE